MRSLAHFPAWASLGATPLLFYPKHFEQKKAHLKSNNQTKLEQKQNQTTNDNLSSFHTWQGGWEVVKGRRNEDLPELGCDLYVFVEAVLLYIFVNMEKQNMLTS